MSRMVVATRNPGKVRELRRLFDGLDIELLSLADVDEIPETIEDLPTFEGNARKKAREVAQATGLMALADDSGLEVDALGGAPGVRSARYGGESATDLENNTKLMAALVNVPDGNRGARFRCALALSDPHGPLGEVAHVEEGMCEGHLLRTARGDGGFGYDPLFVPKGETRAMAELTPVEKNERSHRAAAAARMRTFLEDYLPRRRRSKG